MIFVLWKFCTPARQLITIIDFIEDDILFISFIISFFICLEVCYFICNISCAWYCPSNSKYTANKRRTWMRQSKYNNNKLWNTTPPL